MDKITVQFNPVLSIIPVTFCGNFYFFGNWMTDKTLFVRKIQMHYSNLDLIHQAFILNFVKDNYKERQGFNFEISDRDEMFRFVVPGYSNAGDAYLAYMQSGGRMMNVVSLLADFAFKGLSNVRSFLEFACGYGRFTRHWVMKYPPERTFVSDIYKEAVDWQHQQLGVCGVYSTPSPKEFPLVATFDIIFVGSLFSHLPKNLFEEWLKKLFGMLSPNGVIAFSVHDSRLLPYTKFKFFRKKKQLFHYFGRSESNSLSRKIYGTSHVSEKYVAELINKVCPESRGVYRRFANGLYENQDIYIIQRGANVDWSHFELEIPPIGGKWFCESQDTEIVGSAWALNLDTRSRIDFADIYTDSTHLMKTPTYIETSDNISLIKRHFADVQNIPVRCDFRLPKEKILPGSVLKCRFSVTPDCYFDVFMDYITFVE